MKQNTHATAKTAFDDAMDREFQKDKNDIKDILKDYLLVSNEFDKQFQELYTAIVFKLTPEGKKKFDDAQATLS
jgi:hypothetical protein